MITQIRKRDYTDWKGSARIFLCIALVVLCAAGAQAAYALNVSPTRIEIVVAPSGGYENVLTVSNTQKGTLGITLRIEDWCTARAVPEAANTAAHLPWLQVEPKEFELGEAEAREVSFKVAMPSAVKGELSAMIFVEARPRDIAKGAVAVNTSIGIPIYVTAKGTQRYGAEVEDLRATRSAPLELAVIIKNTGNVHIRPKGTILIRNRWGRCVAQTALNEYNYPVLPFSSRVIEVKTKDRLKRGDYKAEVRMGYADRTYSAKFLMRVD